MTTTVLLALLKKLEGKVDSLETISFEPVTELPETGEPNVIYLVPKSNPETGNYSDEYIWDSDNQTYEKIGDTAISPTNTLIIEGSISNNGTISFNDTSLTQNDVFNLITNANFDAIIRVSDFNIYGHRDFYPISASSLQIYMISYFNDATQDNIPQICFRTAIIRKSSTSKTVATNERLIYAKKYDNNLDGSSHNAVKNKVVKEALDLKSESTAVAPLYDATSTYELDDLVMYNGELYRCTTAISTPEAWDSTHWTKTDIISEMPVIPPIPADANHNIASAYDSTVTYDVGDLCIYDGNLYECSTAISTAEEWTAAHWTQKTVAQELAGAGGSEIEIFEGAIQNKKINLLNNKKVEDIFNAVNNGKRVILKAGNCLFYNTRNDVGYTLGFTSLSAVSPNSSSYNMYIYYAECYSSGLQRTYIDLISPNNTVGYSSIQKLFLQPSNGNYKYYGYSTDINGVAILVKDRSRLIANLYDIAVTYNSGDLAIDRTSLELYRCNTDNTTGTWDSSKWDQVTVEDLLNDIPALPAVTSADAGKMAIVDSNGEWAASEPSGGASYVELGGKLLAGNNTLTFNNECITVGSIFEFYTDAYGVNPTDVSVTDGTLVLTFDVQQNNLKVKVRVWEDENPITVIKSVDILTSDTGPVSAAVKFTYKEDNVEISEQTILYSQTDPPINIGDLILVDYGITYAGHWTIKAVHSCVYNGTVYAVGEIIRHWEFTEEVDFTVVENI